MLKQAPVRTDAMSRRSRGRSIGSAVAVVLYLLLLPFPFLASVLLAPAEGVAVLLAGWLLGAAALVVLARRRS